MASLVVLGISIALQVAAAIMALRLVRTTGRHLAWLLIAAALVMMAVRRSITFYHTFTEHLMHTDEAFHTHDIVAELVALGISAMMLAGMALIAPMFSARARAEVALREAEATYRGILENSADTFYRTDEEGRIVLVSRSAADLLGYSADELTGRKLADLYYHPDGREKFLTAMQQSGGRIRGYEGALRHKNGDMVIVATSASFVHGEDGDVIGVEGIARDITEQKRAENLSNRLGRIVEDSVNEVYVFDSEDLHFLGVNRGARENLGYTMEQLRHMMPLDLKPEFEAEQFETLVAPLRDGSVDVVDFETVHQRQDGTIYDVEVRLQLARNEDPPVFFAIIQDVTERRRTEDALHQAQKMEAVGQLTGGIAHDFNNLLAVITGNIDLVRDGLEDGSGTAEQLDRALGAAERGALLTERLLAFSRRQALQPKVVNLDTIVSGMSELLHRTLGEPIDVEICAEDGLWNCEIDPGQLENALLNLAINARDAMPDGGKLSISLSNVEFDGAAAADGGVAPGDYVRLKVQDTGTGMSAETVEHAFEPFFTTKAIGEGTGLGLSMVHGFVKQSQGHIRICSEEGDGTAIGIFLPRSLGEVEHDVAPEAAVDPDPGAERRKVLVVEDDADVRELVVNMLDTLGYRTFAAASGDQALALLEGNGAIDTLLTDVVLAGRMSGPDLADQAVRRDPDLKVLYMSGYTRDKTGSGRQTTSDIDLLQKPFTKQDLSERLQAIAG